MGQHHHSNRLDHFFIWPEAYRALGCANSLFRHRTSVGNLDRKESIGWRSRRADHAWGAARLFGAARRVGLLGSNHLGRALRNDRSAGRQRRPWRRFRHQRRGIDLGKHDAMPEVGRCWSHAKRTAFAPLPSHRTQRGGDDVTVPFRTEQRLFLVDAIVLIALLLIIVPNYVNLVAISLASPLTVRVVLAIGPALIFFCQ